MKNYVESRRSHHPHRTEYNHGSYGSQSIVNHHQSNSYPYHKMRLSHPTHRPAPYPPDRFARGPSGPYGPITGASRGPPPGTSRRMYDYDDCRGNLKFNQQFNLKLYFTFSSSTVWISSALSLSNEQSR